MATIPTGYTKCINGHTHKMNEGCPWCPNNNKTVIKENKKTSGHSSSDKTVIKTVKKDEKTIIKPTSEKTIIKEVKKDEKTIIKPSSERTVIRGVNKDEKTIIKPSSEKTVIKEVKEDYNKLLIKRASIVKRDKTKRRKPPLKKTVIKDNKASINPSSEKTVIKELKKDNKTVSKASFDRTIIKEIKKDKNTASNNEPLLHANKAQTSKRKLTAWLVSYSNNPLGSDYKIYEGKNYIGKKNSDIIIQGDESISSIHALILSKKDKFWIRDEMSTNGTIINKEEIEPNGSNEIKDGDEIILGLSIFKFKTTF